MEQNDSKLTYEEAIKELESIVREMQGPECSIDKLSKYTTRSLELLKICKEKLTVADENVKEILEKLGD